MPIGLFLTVVISAVKNDKEFINNYYLKLAISLDQLGNVALQRLFNLLFLNSRSCAKFGNEDETISSVLGKNSRAATLTLSGYCLDRMLNKLDKGHSINSIEEDEK